MAVGMGAADAAACTTGVVAATGGDATTGEVQGAITGEATLTGAVAGVAVGAGAA